MGILTADMKRVVEEQRLGFFVTVCTDGTPKVSPKGTTAVWDDDHLIFANIRSPGTLANLGQNPNIEVNLVDPVARKGYRFKGVASVLDSGDLYDQAMSFYKARGSPRARRAQLRRWCEDPADEPHDWGERLGGPGPLDGTPRPRRSEGDARQAPGCGNRQERRSVGRDPGGPPRKGHGGG